MNIFELSGNMKIDGLDKTKTQLTGLEKNVQKVQKGMKIMGAAFTAVGVAGLAMIQSTKKINAQLGVTALNLGVTTQEMRDLTLATTNVTFPIGEVTKSFDLLARAGIKNMDVMKATATAFDTLGDATGRSASQVTEVMIPAMKTFRLSAEEIASKTDMMTYMVRNSTISLEDFNTMVGYTDQEMVAAGFTIDDMTAAMIYMSDQGVEPGKVMLREWNKAVTRSKEENISMTEALGMTNDELEIYKGKLAGATGMTQEYADAANEQYTIMDKLRHKWSELTLQYGTFLQPLEPILATMTAMGPVMLLFSTVVLPKLTFATMAARIKLIALAIATKAVTAAQWLWNIALSANPIGVIIMAIAALTAGIWALWKNWDRVVSFFTGGSKEMESSVDELVAKVREASGEMIVDAEEATRARISEARKVVADAIEGLEQITATERKALQERADFYKDKHYERMDFIDEQMMAEIRAIDPMLAAELEASNEEIKLINRGEKVREAAAERARIRGLKKQLEDEDLSNVERRRIERELASTDAQARKEVLLEQRNEKIKETLTEEYFTNKMTALEDSLVDQKTILNNHSDDLVKVYEDDEKAFKESLDKKGVWTQEYVDDVLAEYSRITELGATEPSFTPPGILPPSPGQSVINLPGKAKGGLIPEPTLLYGLRSRRPYGIAGEAGVETIVPGTSRLGGLTVNVYPQTLIGTKEEIVRYVREALLETQGSNVNLGFL